MAAQGATAAPEHARHERAVADPIVNKPILKTDAQPMRPNHDRGPAAQVPSAVEHLLGGPGMRQTQLIDRPAAPHTGLPRIKPADDLQRRVSPAFGAHTLRNIHLLRGDSAWCKLACANSWRWMPAG